MKTILCRLTALLLCLCLLPAFAFADTNHGTPVTRSDLVLNFDVYPEGFPDDGLAHYEDWKTFLDKISLQGEMRAQKFLSPYSRVMLDGGVYLNGKNVIPFEYDGYYSFRYLRTPAFGGASVHFQMFNFFQFMLKPYYYMGLPTQLIALPMYPEAAVEMWQKYAGPMAEVLGGEGSRTVSYEELYALCEELDLIITEDDYFKAYYFLTCLFIDFGLDWTLQDKLGYLEYWLDYLDPEQQGLTITAEGENETWVLGETTVFEKNAEGFSVYLPDEEGYEFCFDWANDGDNLSAAFVVNLEGGEYLNARLAVDGMESGEGAVHIDVTGDGMWYDIPHTELHYRFTRTAEALPYSVSFEADYVHPETGLPCIGLKYAADMDEMDYTGVYDRPIDNQDDFFMLNESFLSEYKERFLPTIALAATPIALELPAGVISDVIGFMETTGLLTFMGIE